VAELGLFNDANPVTNYTPAQAVATALQGTNSSGNCGHFTFAPPPIIPPPPTGAVGPQSGPLQPVGDLPAGLDPKRFVRAKVCAQAGKLPNYPTHFVTQLCGATFFAQDPWVECATRRVLVQDVNGNFGLYEHPCLSGYTSGEYKLYDLDGVYICSVFPTVRTPPNPDLPYGKVSYGVGTGPGGTLQPGYGGSVGGGIPGISVAGVNVSQIVSLLTGTGATVDLSGVLTILAALVVQGGNIRGSLDSIAPNLGDTLAPGFLGFTAAMDSIAPGLGSRLALALDQHASTTADRAQNTAAAMAASFVPLIGPLYAELSGQAPALLAKLADVYKGSVDSLIGAMLALFRDDIEAHAPVTPANVDKVAAAALRSALTAGSVAQLSGMALELLHPLKNLGIQQAIGVLATFAGFEEIASPFFNATLRYGIGLPAEHRAASHFRTVLPPVEVTRELAAIGLINANKYHQRLELAGYPDPYPAGLTDILYTPPQARFLAQLLDGSESDRAWLARQFRRLGFSPENTAKAVQAAELKTTAPGRGRLVSALLAEYKAGRLEAPDLDAGLVTAGLTVTHRTYYRQVADLDRRGDRMERVATEVLVQYVNDIVTVDVVRQELAALGFTDDEITVRLTVADLKRNRAQVAAEVKGAEAEIKALKTRGLALAQKQLRAGFVDLPTFLTVTQAMGFTRQLAQVAADTALLQGKVKTTAAQAAIGTGALEETQHRIAALIAAEVTARRTDRVLALASLRRVGLPTDLASTIVDLAEAIAGPNAVEGDYGMPLGGTVGGAFGAIASSVLGGLGTITSPVDLLQKLLTLLGLPAHDRNALVGLIRDIKTLFGG
jgi:hypothetical protein